MADAQKMQGWCMVRHALQKLKIGGLRLGYAAGLMRSLGDARVSIVPLPGVHGEVVVTIAWELSWYQYRVDPDGPQAVRLAERGYEVDDIDDALRDWNARLAEDGRVMPEIARL